jgi:hypothetical protein
MTEEQAALRFHQVQRLERQLAMIQDEVEMTARRLKDLKADEAAFLKRLRHALRDEGELPLLDLDE